MLPGEPEGLVPRASGSSGSPWPEPPLFSVQMAFFCYADDMLNLGLEDCSAGRRRSRSRCLSASCSSSRGARVPRDEARTGVTRRPAAPPTIPPIQHRTVQVSTRLLHCHHSHADSSVLGHDDAYRSPSREDSLDGHAPV